MEINKLAKLGMLGHSTNAFTHIAFAFFSLDFSKNENSQYIPLVF